MTLPNDEPDWLWAERLRHSDVTAGTRRITRSSEYVCLLLRLRGQRVAFAHPFGLHGAGSAMKIVPTPVEQYVNRVPR
jgi:hypothetical protein